MHPSPVVRAPTPALPSLLPLLPPLGPPSPRALAAGAALATLLLMPAPVRAQHAELGVFGAWYPSLHPVGAGGSLPLWGLSVGGGGTGIGLRASGAVRISSAASTGGPTNASGASPTWGSAGWVADVDMVYDTRNNPLLQPLTTALLGFAPSFFAGAGGMGRRDADGAMRAVPVFSYGGGVSRAIAGNLGLTTEARYRSASRGTDGALPDGIRSGWEYRAGLSLRFGGARGATGRGGLPRLPIPLPGNGGAVGSASGAAVVDTGDDYLGVPYVYGGSTPRGFDCSGFVQYVFNRNGVRLPRTSRQQAQVGRGLPTSVGALKPGDLIFFNTEGGRIDHVAMYAGGNRIIHSSSSGGGVRYDDLGTSRGRWFMSKAVAARRVTDGRGNSLVDAATLTRLLGEVVRTFDEPDRAPRP